MKKILVIRFSAMGDVALCAPVIKSVLNQHPNLNIVFLSRGFFEPFFEPNNRLTFEVADLKGKHKGANGLLTLKKELCAKHQFDAIVDLHDVLRTKILRSYFKWSRIPVFTINKGRKEKEKMIAGKISFQPLKHSTQRYLDVFEKTGIQADLEKGPWLIPTSNSSHPFIASLGDKTNKWIGIAPFAAHPSKEWNHDKMLELVKMLGDEHTVFLFGGGAREIKILQLWQAQVSSVISVAGQLNLNNELELMQRLDIMLAMDSANMHMATLVGTKTVSIWGPTHPYLGFGPLENEDNIVQLSKDQLPCRPCTIYGKLQSKQDEICAQQSMEQISVEMVLDKINKVLNAV